MASIVGGQLFGGTTPILSPVGNAPASHFMPPLSMAYTPRLPSLPSSPRAVNTPAKSHYNHNSSNIGDVGEPMWVQLSHPNGSSSYHTQVSQSSHAHHSQQTQYMSNTPSTPHPHQINTTNNNYNSNPDSSRDQSSAIPMAYSVWLDPDEASMIDTKKIITSTDKKIFWEMAKAIIELPEITEYCNCSIKNSNDLAALLKRPEFKILWTPDAADILPKHCASELVTAAYAQSSDK